MDFLKKKKKNKEGTLTRRNNVQKTHGKQRKKRTNERAKRETQKNIQKRRELRKTSTQKE